MQTPIGGEYVVLPHLADDHSALGVADQVDIALEQVDQPHELVAALGDAGPHGERGGPVSDGLPPVAVLHCPCYIGVGADPPRHTGAAHGEQHWFHCRRGGDEPATHFQGVVHDPGLRHPVPALKFDDHRNSGVVEVLGLVQCGGPHPCEFAQQERLEPSNLRVDVSQAETHPGAPDDHFCALVS